MIEAPQCLHGMIMYSMRVFSPRAMCCLMGEKETECIVTPCGEPKGG